MLSHPLLPSFSFLRSSSGHVSAGSPHPLGATWDGRGTNFALFSANATKVELCLFEPRRQARDRARHLARAHRRCVARLSLARGARPALRLSRARPLRAGGRPPVQPAQAADRPIQQAARRAILLERCAFRLSHRRQAGRPVIRPARQCALHAQVRRRRHRAHLGARTPAGDGVGRHHHLRGACQRPHAAAQRRPRGSARHVSRTGGARDRSRICESSASARSSCCRSMPFSTTAISSSAA